MATILQIGTQADLTGLQTLHGASQVFEGDLKAAAVAMEAALAPAAAQAAESLEVLSTASDKAAASAKKHAAAAKEEALSLEQVKEVGKSSMEGLSSAAMSAGGGMASLGAALGIGAVTEFIEHMKEATLELSHLAEATGIPVENLTMLKDAMEAAGVSTERLPMQMTQLASAMEAAADGSDKQVQAFAALGVNTDKWASEMPSELEILKQLSEHAHTSSDAVRDLAAMKVLLGRNAVGLTAFLKQGTEAIEEQESHFKEHAKVMGESVENAMKLQRAETEFKTTLETQLAPVLGLVVDMFTGLSIMLVYAKAGWNDLIAVGGIVVATFSMVGSVMERLFHLDFKGAIAAEKQGLQEMADAWVYAKDTMIKEAAEAEKKTGEIMQRANAPIRKPEEGAGPAAPLRKPGKDSQAELDANKRIADEQAKLLADQGKYQAVVSAQTSQLVLAEQQLSNTKNLDEKRAYVAQVSDILMTQARAEKDAELTASTQKFEADQKYVHDSLALHQSASETDKKERARLHGELALLELKHQDEMVNIGTRFETRMAAARQRVANENARIDIEQASRAAKTQEDILRGKEAALDGELKALDSSTKRQAATITESAKLHQITNQQEHDALIALYEQEYKQRLDLQHKKEQIFIQEAVMAAAAEGRVLTEEQAKLLPGYQKLYNQELEDYDKFLDRKLKADQDAQNKLQKESERTAQTLSTMYDQMFLHASNFHEAVSNLWQSLSKNFEQAATHMLSAWITSMLEGKMVSAETALGQIAHSAYVSAANVYGATSGIPIIGPVLAPIAAAAAFTAVMAFGGGIGAAEHGAVLPQDMMILAHRNEMILPPALSAGFQAMVAGGTSPGGQAAPANVTYAPQIHAVDGPSVQRTLTDHTAIVSDVIKKMVKGGHLSMADFMRG